MTQNTKVSKINDYKFNGQEWQEELGLDVTAMDYRQYDNALGRFNCIDPVTHFSQSSYQFGNGNPMYRADPSGLDGITPEPINTWHYAGGNQMNTGTGNLSNGDHMFGASGDSFWGGQAAFTGGDLAWKNYNAANGIQTFYGAEARAVFSHLGYKNGFRSFMYPDSESTVLGGMGVGFYKKKAPSYFQGYFDGPASGEYGPNSMLPDAMSLNYELSANGLFFSGNLFLGLALTGNDAAIVFGGGLQLGLQSDLAFPGFKGGWTAAVHNQMGNNSDVLGGLAGNDIGTFAGFGIRGSQSYSLKNGTIDKDGVSTTSVNIGPTFGIGQTQSTAYSIKLSGLVNYLKN